ncbi:dihydrolipoamide acetyltransferase family protein [Litoribrevibacter albus]|uniref:Dihydrolipoamide acetyltransferase component of pyruvate dehydrogenase complex n=1 Tax=Litoribrevibacter albus TaxID=1473156 RepID=A0AA37SAI0_9GAMM|nr:dihydrolipoamide acetyltransferase family protein [Litoribrevibacter albus]GLQ32145.1 dihydrolipoamide acetyltransferase component of pyruvate dehydrogenase complex [Litoribrevibacter albus]
MKYFKLPDLGEGLSEAEIVEWHIKEGDEVKEDQLLVSVETAKAIVDLPSPVSGKVVACFGQPGDVLHIGDPLVEYDSLAEDTGTVVGKIPEAKKTKAKKSTQAATDQFIIGSPHSAGSAHHSLSQAKATPSVRALARRLGVDIDAVKGSGPEGRILAQDVESSARIDQEKGQGEPLRGVRRTMAKTMSLSHQHVVPVSIFDVADVDKWPEGEDTTIRLAKAIAAACAEEPAMNVWFDGEHMSRRLCSQVDLAIAVDTDQGLFVPVLRDINNRSLSNLREGLNRLRADVKARTIPPSEMLGATITLSNFGTMAGRFATPVVVPPTVAIVGAGKIYQDVVVYKGKAEIRSVMPISVTFDHRAVTGGEAARFLEVVLKSLSKKRVK